MIGLYDAMPVWFANDAPNTSKQIRLVHEPARNGRAAAAEHTARERMVVGDDALGLERREDRRVQSFGEGDDVVDAGARAVADTR